MPTSETAKYDELTQQITAGRSEAALDALADYLRDRHRYDELFELRLLAGRLRLGLPVDETTRLEDLPEPVRSQMEQVYLDACREVGLAWLEAGDVRRGWTFLAPLGEPALVAERLARIEPNEENLEPLIEVSLYGGVSPPLGIRLVLDHYGICNAITICQSSMHAWTPQHRAEVAEELVRRLHAELLENVRADVRNRLGGRDEAPLGELVEQHPELFAERNYHIDASHLAAVVRMAEAIERPETLRLVVEMCAYGERLDPMYHYAGEEPFAETYRAYGLFYAALLGQRVDEALGYFADKARELEDEAARRAAVATQVNLLVRHERYDEALTAALAGGLPIRSAGGQAVPSLLWLANRCGSYQAMLDYCRQRDDIVGYAAGLLAEAAQAGAAADAMPPE